MNLTPGSIVAFDRAYNDYALFGHWTAAGVFLVTRMKDNAIYQVIEERKLPTNRPIRADQIIRLTGTSAEVKCPHHLRRVVVWNDVNEREIVLLTNHLTFGNPPLTPGSYTQLSLSGMGQPIPGA